jgi:hypothetical protein
MLKFNDFEVLNENASYRLPNRVDSLIRAFIAREPTISVEPWPERISKEGDKKQFLGIRMYLNDVLFRINWREGSSVPDMIDVWNSSSKNTIMPKFSLMGNFELFRSLSQNIMQLVMKLANTKGVPMAMEVSESGLGGVNPNVVNAPPEQTDDTAQPEADLETDDMNVFDELRSLVIMVINNINPSLIITGRGGVGKTHTVIQTMKEFDIKKDEEYVVIKGASTALSMYKALYFNNDKIVIFDDCDSIFKDADGVNILKAALDSYEEREISWLSRSTYDPNTESPTVSRPVPNRFVFEGQMIFISNLRMNQIDNAIRTRSYTIEINVTKNELFDIMEKNLVNILPNVDMATKKEVFEFIKSEYRSSEESINVRTLIKAIKIRLSGAPNWKKLVSKYA